MATTGDPADWVDTDITPVKNVIDVFSQTPLAAAEWYYPERLSIDAGAAASLQQTPAASYLGLRITQTAQVDVPLDAFQTALGGKDNGVVDSAEAKQAAAERDRKALLQYLEAKAAIKRSAVKTAKVAQPRPFRAAASASPRKHPHAAEL